MDSYGSVPVFTTRRDIESQKGRNVKRHSCWWTILVDVPLLVLVLIFIMLFEIDVISGHKAGFFCGDPSLSFPYNGDSVTSAMLFIAILVSPLVVIITTECVFSDSDYSRKDKLKQAFRRTIHLYKCYTYGLIINITILEVIKGFMGRPRPTFFDLCEPDTAKTCKGNEFVSTFTCTSTRFSWWMQNDSFHSFPSGHTSTAVHFGIFLAWYLQRRAFDWRYRTVFVVPFVQLLALSFTAIASLTRITDHRHHWWDVLTGFFLGVVTAIYAAAVLCKNFSWLTSPDSESSTPLRTSVRTLVFDTQTSACSP